MTDREHNTERIPNPLPDPVQGKREQLEFPFQDVSPLDWKGKAQQTMETAAETMQSSGNNADDFDVQISEDDDFDL